MKTYRLLPAQAGLGGGTSSWQYNQKLDPVFLPLLTTDIADI